MWLVLRQREARPDAPYWPGRRLLAAVDALAWPMLAVAAAMRLPAHGGLVGAVFVAACGMAAALRLRRALWRNHRYRFTTGRFAQAAVAVLAFGVLLRWLVRA